MIFLASLLLLIVLMTLHLRKLRVNIISTGALRGADFPSALPIKSMNNIFEKLLYRYQPIIPNNFLYIDLSQPIFIF